MKTKNSKTSEVRSNRVIYLEGLPCSGKTSLIQFFALNFSADVTIVPEYLDDRMAEYASLWDIQPYFVCNDEFKYQLAHTSTLAVSLVDRGHLSTVIYNILRITFVDGHDSSFVMDWYMNRILRMRKLPDAYIYLDVAPSLSLRRRSYTLSDRNMWDRLDTLEFAASKYRELMSKFESDIPVLMLDSNKTSVEAMAEYLVKYLNI